MPKQSTAIADDPFLSEEGLAECAMNDGDWDQEKKHLLSAFAKPSRPESELPIAYYFFAMSAQHFSDDTLLQEAKSSAAAADLVLAHPTAAGRAATALSIDRERK